MGPITQSDGHDGPWLGLEFVPGIAAVIEQSISVVEHPIGEPVVAHILSDVLLRVEFGGFRRQRYDRDVVGYGELGGEMPSSLVQQQRCMTAGSDIGGDRREMQVHHRRVAPGQDQSDGLAFFGTDGAEDVG
jgi:hypothetical protein